MNRSCTMADRERSCDPVPACLCLVRCFAPCVLCPILVRTQRALLQVLCHVTTRLQRMHEAGLVHRDLKPGAPDPHAQRFCGYKHAVHAPMTRNCKNARNCLSARSAASAVAHGAGALVSRTMHEHTCVLSLRLLNCVDSADAADLR